MSFKLDTTATRKLLSIAIAPHFKVGINEPWQRFLPANVKRAYGQVTAAHAQLLAQSQQIEKLPPPRQAAAGKANVDFQISQAELAIRQLDTLKAYNEALAGKALHFKLHYTIGDQSVLLAESQAPPSR